MGDATAKAIEEMIKSAADRSAGKAKPRSSTLNRLVRARLASLGLVLTSGFLLTVSLGISAALEGLSQYLQGLFPGADVTLKVFDFLVSTTLISAMFAAIYKALPDNPSLGATWRLARWSRRCSSMSGSISSPSISGRAILPPPTGPRAD